jgi:hypothetical protein
MKVVLKKIEKKEEKSGSEPPSLFKSYELHTTLTFSKSAKIEVILISNNKEDDEKILKTLKTKDSFSSSNSEFNVKKLNENNEKHKEFDKFKNLVEIDEADVEVNNEILENIEKYFFLNFHEKKIEETVEENFFLYLSKNE